MEAWHVCHQLNLISSLIVMRHSQVLVTESDSNLKKLLRKAPGLSLYSWNEQVLDVRVRKMRQYLPKVLRWSQ